MEAPRLAGGRFEILSLAGAGGMGSVYRARDRLTGDWVALKRLPVGSPHRARFRREAEALAALAHPHVVRYVAHGDGSDGEPPFLAMEWIEGESLRERLTHGDLGLVEAVTLARRVAEALGAAHDRGLVHRDVKPENLLLEQGSSDQVKVLDFGVALARNAAGRLSRTGTPLGTIGYMAPEQVRGDSDVDARADVFALGAVLFECLTGMAPFAAADPLAVLAKIVLEDAPPLGDFRSDVPPEIERIVASMLERDREKRPRDGNRVATLLERFDRPSTAPKRGPSLRPPALTGAERTLVSAVLGDAGELTLERTLALEELDDERRRRAEIVQRLGGRFEPLGPRSFVASFSGRGEPSAVAERAARAAMELFARAPGLRVALVAAESSDQEKHPLARAVERAAELVAARGDAGVLVDATMAALLSARFVVREAASGLVLERAREASALARPLLGRRTACVGRTRELETLRALWTECRDEPIARAVLLTGPAGIGKSRVVEELTTELADARIWRGRGDLLRAGTPHALVADLLWSAFCLARPSFADSRSALQAGVAPFFEAEERARVSEFLGVLAGFPLPDSPSRELRAALGDPMLMNDQLRRAFESLVSEVARAGPLLIVLDDLHFGDAPSMKLVDDALRRASELPVLVLGVARPEVRSALPGLFGERDLQEIRVGPLPRKAALELAGRALDGLAVDALEDLVERAQGNPLFLEELIRAHAEGRAAAPGSVLAMVRARFDALEPETRRLLRAASVFGMHFWQSGIESLLADVEQARIEAMLSALAERELIGSCPESRISGERELAFAHDLIREAAYAALTDEDRTLGHRLAAAWLEQHGERDARLLAEHLEQGGLLESAVPCWQKAAGQALEASDFERTLSFVARGKAAGAKAAALGALLLTEAEARRWGGELGPALGALEAGLALLPAGSPRWCQGVAEQALLLQRLGLGDALPALARGVLARSVRDPPSDPLAYALTRSALFCLLAGHAELARELSEAARHTERSGEVIEPATRAQGAVFRALSALYRGDLSGYLREELAAREAFEEAGDVRRALNESGSIGYAQMELGSYAEAERTLVEALARASDLGLEHVKAASWHNLGLVYARLGRFEEAVSVEQKSLAIFRAQSDLRLEGAALTYLAKIELLAGNPTRAEQTARDALELCARVAPPIEPLARGILAAARLTLGDASEALELARAASLALAGGAEAGESLIRLVYADALEASGRASEATNARRLAKERLLARASCIEDPEARRRFLEDVPENARTLARA